MSPVIFADQVPKVVASSKPLHSLISGLMEGIADPKLLIDDDSLPWQFTPKVSQITALESADLIVWSGAELEPGLAATLATIKTSAKIIEVMASKEMKVLPSRFDEHQRDAWFWLDSRNMLILLDDFTRTLMELDDGRASRYEANRSKVLEPIANIDRKMEYGYRDVAGTPVFFYHDTHQYFEQAYAMKVVGNVASPPSAPLGIASGLIKLKSWLIDSPGGCLFTEQALEEPHLELLSDRDKARLIELDTLGNDIPAGKDFYVKLMTENFTAIASCVKPAHITENVLTAADIPGVERFDYRIVPNYMLMNQFGQTITDQSFEGRFQLIGFGYTSCPDICPMTLTVVGQAMKLLGDDAKNVQPIFVSVDPQRDKPNKLGQYVGFFHPDLMALSGPEELTRRTLDNFKVQVEFVPSPSADPEDYIVNHTASLFLLGPQGEFLAKFAYGMSAEEVSAKIRAFIGS